MSESVRVRLTLIEPLLGTASANPDIHREFIASKNPDAGSIEDEVATIGADAVADKGMTVFARMDDGTPMVWDYQIKGFFKDAAGMLRRVQSSKSSNLKAYKKIIDGLIFVEERRIPIEFDGELGNCQRPLRAQTAQGERVALAESEMAPAGSTLTFTITTLEDGLMPAIEEWLRYGRLRGLGQWRNSGMGRFEFEALPAED